MKLKTFDELFSEAVSQTSAEIAEPKKVSKAFEELLLKPDGTKIVFPETSAGVKDVFIDIICRAACEGMNEHDIVESLSRVKIKGDYVGEKAAKTYLRHAMDAIKIEVYNEAFPDRLSADDEDFDKKVLAAIWVSEPKSEITVGGKTYPIQKILNFENTTTDLKRAFQIHKTVTDDPAEKEALANELASIKAKLEDAIPRIPKQIQNMKEKFREYWNRSLVPTRGRGADPYARFVGSELDFDCMEV